MSAVKPIKLPRGQTTLSFITQNNDVSLSISTQNQQKIKETSSTSELIGGLDTSVFLHGQIPK